MAELIRRTYHPRPAPFTDLPFVADVKVAPRKKRRNFWHVPPTDDYGAACTLGRQYACDLVQYLKDNPYWAGSNTIGLLVKDMAAHPQGSAMRGYEVGFFSAIEVLLYQAAARTDHWTALQAVQDRYDAIAQDREVEAAEERAEPCPKNLPHLAKATSTTGAKQ